MTNFKIIKRLLKLIGKFINVLILAVINGAIGFLCGTAITVLGAVGLTKILGTQINMSYELIVILIALGVLTEKVVFITAITFFIIPHNITCYSTRFC